jgi:hypothetical protein
VAKVTASKSQRCAEWTVLPQKNVGQAEEVEGQFRECRHSTVRLGGSYGFWALLMTSVAWRIHVASNTMMGDSETNSNIRMQTKIALHRALCLLKEENRTLLSRFFKNSEKISEI